MRIGPLLSLFAMILVGCADEPPAKSPAASGPDAPSDKASDSAKASAGAKPEVSCKGKPAVGKSAPTFSLATVNGGSKMGVEKGKVTLVDFWATWCGPCQKSFPKYQELYVKYKASGLEVLAVSVDEEKKDIPDFIKSHGAKFPVGWDEGHKIAECYQPETMPSAFVIDKNGVVKYVHAGYKDGDDKELEKVIKGLL